RGAARTPSHSRPRSVLVRIAEPRGRASTTGLIDSQRTPRRSRKWSASHPDERDIGFSSMRLSWSFGPLLAAVLCLFGGMVAAQAPPAPAPQFPAGVELVSVDVVVLDKDGQPGSDLAAGDFKVAEEGAHPAPPKPAAVGVAQ